MIRSRYTEARKEYKTMTVATVRKDGWPQATAAIYFNDSPSLYSRYKKSRYDVSDYALKYGGCLSVTPYERSRNSLGLDLEVISNGRDTRRRPSNLLGDLARMPCVDMPRQRDGAASC